MKLDSHQHFWRYDAGDYPWMEGEEKAVLRRDYLPEDLWREHDAAGVEGSIAVQARQTVEETGWLLDLAEEHERILGVVGWVDLRSEQVEDQLARFEGRKKLVGMRHVVQDESDERFMLRSDFQRGIRALGKRDLAYDILIYPNQLPAAIELARAFPEQRFVLDHMGKPLIRKGVVSPWSEQMFQLSGLGNVWCKVSGMITEADWSDWDLGRMKPYWDVVVSAFGPERLMYGSDWPVCQLAGSYREVVKLVEGLAEGWGERERAGLMGENARRFYLGKGH